MEKTFGFKMTKRYGNCKTLQKFRFSENQKSLIWKQTASKKLSTLLLKFWKTVRLLQNDNVRWIRLQGNFCKLMSKSRQIFFHTRREVDVNYFNQSESRTESILGKLKIKNYIFAKFVFFSQLLLVIVLFVYFMTSILKRLGYFLLRNPFLYPQ